MTFWAFGTGFNYLLEKHSLWSPRLERLIRADCLDFLFPQNQSAHRWAAISSCSRCFSAALWHHMTRFDTEWWVVWSGNQRSKSKVWQLLPLSAAVQQKPSNICAAAAAAAWAASSTGSAGPFPVRRWALHHLWFAGKSYHYSEFDVM